MMAPADTTTSWGIISPKIQLRAGDLVIQTSLFVQVLSLFSCCHTIRVAGLKNQLEIQEKRWWQVLPTITIPFGNIDYIDLIHPPAPEHEDDQIDPIHTIFLMTRNPSQRVDLLTLRCGKNASSPNRAVRCATLISEITGKRVGVHNPKNIPLADFEDTYFCNGCGHRLSPATETLHCPYCGGKDIRIK
ncbi:MAG: hypothetical protein JEZ11_06650 [Desulfobacterales bacterium]|nr:hypothetical protein [Desulfobacterales bacterium]